MKKSISAIVDGLGFASAEEIVSILKELSGEIKEKTLSLKFKELEKESVIFKVLPTESSYGVEGYIAGPNMNAKDDFEIKKLIVERGVPLRDLQSINWESFSSRILNAFLDNIKTLKEDLEKAYDEPKNVEMQYFELSIRYHELYNFFFDRYRPAFLVPAENLLKECREQLNKKEI
jgi:hypothetical protein